MRRANIFAEDSRPDHHCAADARVKMRSNSAWTDEGEGPGNPEIDGSRVFAACRLIKSLAVQLWGSV